MIALKRNKVWEELIHVHDVDGDREYISKVQEYMELLRNKPVNLGNFIYKEVAIDKRPFGGYGIKIDFEYVTVEAAEFTKTVEDDSKLLWKSKDELGDIFIRNYNKMSCAYQQAFPILIKQFWALTRERTDNE